MADIDLYQDECEDPQDDGDEAGLGIEDGDAFNPDDLLTPLQKMEKYMDSENIFSRQMVARSLMETLRAVGDNSQDASIVLSNMVRLAEGSGTTPWESTVRADLVEQVPHVAMYCQENKSLVPNAVPTYILPIITRYLVDSHNLVRKTSQAALLVLLEQELVDRGDFEEQVCPVILELSNAESIDDFRTEAVALMSKMAPQVGPDITERIFMPRFAEMCTDALFHVRKVCAANFGEMCTVVGPDNVLTYLLSRFVLLCEDGVWGVRKACAECFMEVSCACSLEIRKNDLAILFVNLIADQSRWVRMSAFQALGGFISTFADPNSSVKDDEHPEAEQLIELGKRQEELSDEHPSVADGSVDTPSTDDDLHPQPMDIDQSSTELHDSGSQSDEFSLEEKRAEVYKLSSSENSQSPDSISQESDPKHSNVCDNPCDIEDSSNESSGSQSLGESKPIHVHLHNAPTEDYSSFNYWRDPLPEVDVDIETVNDKPTSLNIVTKLEDQTSEVSLDVPQLSRPTDTPLPIVETASTLDVDEDTSEDDLLPVMHQADVSTVSMAGETVANIGSTHVLGQSVSETTMSVINGIVKDLRISPLSYGATRSSSEGAIFLNQEPSIEELFTSQDVIPQPLLDHYLSMSDPSRAQTVDADIARHCAYSLPAVAYTLGRKFWPCLKGLYETLAGDLQWKVRRTLAFSIHEMAIIVGEELTAKDLVPVFNEFLKDLDEVRIGVLKHLADFLGLLTQETRNEYLNKIPVFLDTDNNRNWRFREELGKQLLLLIDLYSADDVSEHLLPIALHLAEDRVAEVRNISLKVLAGMLRQITVAGQDVLVSTFINDIINRFSLSKKWYKRQVFAQLCYEIMLVDGLPQVKLATMLLPSLLALATDPTPNVRIAMAAVMAHHLQSSEYFTGSENPHSEDLMCTLKRLECDNDRDVRYIMGADSTWLPPSSDIAAGSQEDNRDAGLSEDCSGLV